MSWDAAEIVSKSGKMIGLDIPAYLPVRKVHNKSSRCHGYQLKHKLYHYTLLPNTTSLIVALRRRNRPSFSVSVATSSPLPPELPPYGQSNEVSVRYSGSSLCYWFCWIMFRMFANSGGSREEGSRCAKLSSEVLESGYYLAAFAGGIPVSTLLLFF